MRISKSDPSSPLFKRCGIALLLVAGSAVASHPAVSGVAIGPIALAVPFGVAVVAFFGLVLPVMRQISGTLAEVSAERDGVRTTLARLKAELEVAEAALERAEKARAGAEGKLKAKANYLSAISHEVRAPLNGVIGMSDLMAETALDDEQKALVETVRQSAETLQSVLSNVIDFASLENGKLVLEDKPYDIREVAEAALLAELPMAQKKGVELVFDAPRSLLTQTRGDPIRVRQMISMLISNSVKFTERGEVVLSLRSAERAGTAEMQVRVRDSGIGIAREDLGQVFQPFERGGAARSQRFTGPGLGLSIAQRLARLMDGSIFVQSTAGQGSEFTLSFAHRLRPTARGETPSDIDLSGQRYLILDDCRSAAEVLAGELKGFGAEVVSATGLEEGEDALWDAMAGGPKFRAIWLDVSLPGVDALSLAARIADKIEDIPLILMAPHDPRGAKEAVDKGIGLTHVEKPFRNETIARTLTKIDLHWASVVRTKEDDGPATPLRPASVAVATGLQPACIILADDNATNRILIEKFLADEPMTLIHAPDGVGAVQAFQDWAPDLILMDVSMPRMDGLEATQKIRAAEQAQGLGRLPIIALTARALAEDREKCLAAGMDDYVTKPIRKSELKAKITEWTVARRQSA